MKTMTDENFDRLHRWISNVDHRLSVHLEEGTPEYDYHVGAMHAFTDVNDLIQEAEPKKTAIESKGLKITLVTVGVVGAVTYRKEIKAGIQKLKAKFRG